MTVEKPTEKRLVYAAQARCPCGAGLAHWQGDRGVFSAEGGSGGYWDCSAILLGTADPDVQHTAKLPFVFYEIKSEHQPSARGATTRPSDDS